MTPQRRTWQQTAVEEAIGADSTFVSAQELHRRMQGSERQVGLATVYRVLKRLVSLGQVDALQTTDGETLYRACEVGHHHHLVCESCGATVDVEPPDESWMDEVARQHGFEKVRHVVDIYGRCAACRERAGD
ncbi:Fur family transcriptional regulator [Georgenia sp. Z1344]|uniref:Fur family transcriptional regulator n=1 Tax=Georgenia sp. Z1344 TaxID=3416706 RepID=UPI003CED059E